MHPIKLEKELGPVVFLGGINAMPMMYALELKKQEIEVLYFVDRPANDTLSRPENHFQDIKYPYPDWVVEAVLPTQIFLPLFPRLFTYWIMKKVAKHTDKLPQAFVLNGFFCSLSPYLERCVPKVFLPGGADLDSWADVDGAEILGKTFSGRSIFKYLPNFLSIKIINCIVQKQFAGASNCSKVVFFPKGFNKAGDRVLRRIEATGVDILGRYDVSFEPLKHEERGVIKSDGKLVIFSGVRFLFRTFPDGNKEYGKGNDLIIKGLSEYYRLNKNIEIHFVEKGEDVAEAKRLISACGINEVVVWHKEMKFIDLLALYRMADVCFDQVGEHWIGAIGFYALWLGKPLIANDRRAVDAGVWDEDAPILSASTAEQIRNHLISMESCEKRACISGKAMRFAESALGPNAVLRELFDCAPTIIEF